MNFPWNNTYCTWEVLLIPGGDQKWFISVLFIYPAAILSSECKAQIVSQPLSFMASLRLTMIGWGYATLGSSCVPHYTCPVSSKISLFTILSMALSTLLSSLLSLSVTNLYQWAAWLFGLYVLYRITRIYMGWRELVTAFQPFPGPPCHWLYGNAREVRCTLIPLRSDKCIIAFGIAQHLKENTPVFPVYPTVFSSGLIHRFV